MTEISRRRALQLAASAGFLAVSGCALAPHMPLPKPKPVPKPKPKPKPVPKPTPTTRPRPATTTTTVAKPGTGGKAALRRALGVAAGGGNDQPTYELSVAHNWAVLAGMAAPTFNIAYVEASSVDPSLLESVSHLYENTSTPRMRVRLDLCTDSLRAVAGGAADSTFAANAQLIQRVAAAQGRPQPVGLGWEYTGDWYAWGIGNGHNPIADFVDAWEHVVPVMRSAAPGARFYLMGGNDPTSLALMKSSLPDLATVDGVGFDDYNDGKWDADTSAGRLVNLKANLANFARWAVELDRPIGIGELGVANPNTNQALIDAGPYIQAYCDWMAALPATGGGMIDHYLPFDIDPVTDYSGNRGFSLTPVVGKTVVQTLLANLA